MSAYSDRKKATRLNHEHRLRWYGTRSKQHSRSDYWHCIEGPVDWVVARVSVDLVAEFVVLGNVSRQGIAGLSLGSTAESNLDALNTNVLMVRVTEDKVRPLKMALDTTR